MQSEVEIAIMTACLQGTYIDLEVKLHVSFVM